MILFDRILLAHVGLEGKTMLVERRSPIYGIPLPDRIHVGAVRQRRNDPKKYVDPWPDRHVTDYIDVVHRLIAIAAARDLIYEKMFEAPYREARSRAFLLSGLNVLPLTANAKHALVHRGVMLADVRRLAYEGRLTELWRAIPELGKMSRHRIAEWVANEMISMRETERARKVTNEMA